MTENRAYWIFVLVTLGLILYTQSLEHPAPKLPVEGDLLNTYVLRQKVYGIYDWHPRLYLLLLVDYEGKAPTGGEVPVSLLISGWTNVGIYQNQDEVMTAQVGDSLITTVKTYRNRFGIISYYWGKVKHQ